MQRINNPRINVPVEISLIASSIRFWLWAPFINSLLDNDVTFEVILVGDFEEKAVEVHKAISARMKDTQVFKIIRTGHIKPAQCYEIARRAAVGRLIHWTADDCEYSPKALDNICKFYDMFISRGCVSQDLILSIQTIESGYFFKMDDHRFFYKDQSSPLMAPLGVLRREYLDSLGGFDRRFVSGQWENDVVMRSYAAGGTVAVYSGAVITIDHHEKHLGNLGSKFRSAYLEDRGVLESLWPGGKIKKEVDLEPYSDESILTKSQGNRGIWV